MRWWGFGWVGMRIGWMRCKMGKGGYRWLPFFLGVFFFFSLLWAFQVFVDWEGQGRCDIYAESGLDGWEKKTSHLGTNTISISFYLKLDESTIWKVWFWTCTHRLPDDPLWPAMKRRGGRGLPWGSYAGVSILGLRFLYLWKAPFTFFILCKESS